MSNAGKIFFGYFNALKTHSDVIDLQILFQKLIHPISALWQIWRQKFSFLAPGRAEIFALLCNIYISKRLGSSSLCSLRLEFYNFFVSFLLESYTFL